MRERRFTLFFAASACSWMPHWACHFYRLETRSTFVVGDWSFSRLDSQMAMVIYTILVALNLLAVVSPRTRLPVGVLSGLLHLAFAALHGWRLFRPFHFEVLGVPWPADASLREVAIVGLWGALTLFVTHRARRQSRSFSFASMLGVDV
jgi:hypothetical protein